MPSSLCIVNGVTWVSMQYSAKLKRWARRDWILLLYLEASHLEARTHRSAVMVLVV
jgi:hypothetical protein